MRIWDIDPGFLNDKSLLGEHMELHAIVSVLVNDRKGYAHHPETLRWRKCVPALAIRHALLAREMTFRGFSHRSPLPVLAGTIQWPERYIDPPADQYRLLDRKYIRKKPGRIPLPRSVQQLWACHKYSVMARSPEDYQRIGPRVADGALDFPVLANLLPTFLRIPPLPTRLRNAIEHMWGYVADFANDKIAARDTVGLLSTIQKLAALHNVEYIIHSTALVELQTWDELRRTGMATVASET